MNKYHAKIEYYKATMDTPFCLIRGEREVVAASEDDAKQAIVDEAKMYGVDNIAVTEINIIK